jgi:hypothetical protein
MVIEIWILWAWLCAGPGRTGECAPLPDRLIEGRGLCLRQARETREAFPQINAHCRRAKQRNPITDSPA